MGSESLDDGLQHYNQGRFDEAVDNLKDYLRDNSDDLRARAYLGAALGKLARYAEAAEEFLFLTRMEPGNARHYYNLARSYEHAEKNTRAAGAYEKVLQIDPGNKKAQERLQALKDNVQPPGQTPQQSPSAWVQPQEQQSYSDQQTSYQQPTPHSYSGHQTVYQPPPQQPYVGQQPPLQPFPEWQSGSQQHYHNSGQTYQESGYDDKPAQSTLPSWLIVIILILFPPVGLVLVWWKTTWKLALKIVLTVIVAIVLFGMFDEGPINTASDVSTDSSRVQQQSQ